MGIKNSKSEKKPSTNIEFLDRPSAHASDNAVLTSVDFDSEDFDSEIDSSTQLNSLTELGSMSNSSNHSQKSIVSNKSQKKRKRRKSKELRKIRDKPNRMCRKASTAPDQAFIVEEALLEDLCAIAGEEAHDGGNIILSREKEELIRRLSVNQATADVFKNTKNIRKFSTKSLRGDDPDLSSLNLDIQRRSTMKGVSPNGSINGSIPKSPNGNQKRGSFIATTGSILLNTEGIEDPVRLRRQSIKQVQTSSPKGAHELMTQANYRTEIQALKLAQKRESCTCARNCFALCNIYI